MPGAVQGVSGAFTAYFSEHQLRQNADVTLRAMKVGFTGTRYGMTPEQKQWLEEAFKKIKGEWEFHHGSCVGADTEAHHLAKRFGAWIVIHPPKIPYQRAQLEGSEMRPERSYIERNMKIVDQTDVLIAMPAEASEQEHSGTWSMVRYAREVGRKLRIIGPGGVRIE